MRACPGDGGNCSNSASDDDPSTRLRLSGQLCANPWTRRAAQISSALLSPSRERSQLWWKSQAGYRLLNVQVRLPLTARTRQRRHCRYLFREHRNPHDQMEAPAATYPSRIRLNGQRRIEWALGASRLADG